MSLTSGWSVKRLGKEGCHTIIVIKPDHDLIVHTGPGCECRPVKSLERVGPHVMGAIISHNALDGRL